jgi:voltage-gated potassium channel
MLEAPSTARRAGQWIAVSTLVVSIAGGVAIWLLDRDEFPSLESGLWWAVQTVTTVGYGDHVPADGVGRGIAAIVMLTGIGFLSVVTASISAAFVESARRRRGRNTDDLLLERLQRIEQALEELRATRESG